MSYELFLKLYDRAGDTKRGAIFPLWARFADSVNADDPLVFRLNADSDPAQAVEELDIVEAFIRNREIGLISSDGGFVSAFVGIIRDFDISTDESSITYIDFIAPAENHILSWRSVLFYAGADDRSTFESGAAETIMKTVIEYNFTASAIPANGRHRNGDLLPGMGLNISIGADMEAGNLLSASFMGSNVLTALQKLAENGGGDFQLSWLGGNDWEFEFYPGQLGNDKSSGPDRVLFSLQNNTMRNPRLIKTGARASSGVAAGEGQGDLREITEVFGPDYSPDYDFETFVDARQEKTEAGREYRGALKLDEQKAKEELSFTVLQTSNQFYSPIDITGKKTYKAGDLILANYRGVDQVRKIERIQVYWNDPSSEDSFIVDVTTREVVSNGS